MYKTTLFAFLAAVLFLAQAINCGAAQDRQAQKTNALKNAYQMLLAEVDKNKDGKISMDECLSVWKDKAVGESKCKVWNKNGDGFITEDEYVQQGLKIMK